MADAENDFHKVLEATNLSQLEAIEYGRKLREQVPRKNHGQWQVPAGRRDPVEILIESSEGRLPNLIPIRYGRMLQSPFTFFRGSATLMASDLATTANTGIYVRVCGDCHVLNFGAFGTPERSIVFDINDFDETLPAPWEWDVKRLATSIILASRANKFDKGAARDATIACIESYRKHTQEYGGLSPIRIWYTHISIDDIMNMPGSDKTKKRFMQRVEKARQKTSMDTDFPELTAMKYGKAYIKDNPPLIYHRTDIDANEYHKQVEAAFQEYINTLGEEKRVLLDQYKFQDIAMKVVGVGSVGTRCAVGLRMSADNDPLFLQVKEARPSVLAPYAGNSRFENHGQRVVVGQKMMQAISDTFLGYSPLVEGRYYYVRQLHDMKIKPHVELFDEEALENFAKLCGWSLALAHARSGRAAIIGGYMGNSTAFDDAMADFAIAYADQNELDYQAMKDAVADGRIEAFIE